MIVAEEGRSIWEETVRGEKQATIRLSHGSTLITEKGSKCEISWHIS
jgi:hypothetical protein